MKISELLRKLADMVAASEEIPVQSPEPPSFVPPLQAKLELLKKSVGVESTYDEEDELGRIKKNAGIQVVVADEASSSEPLDV